MKSFANLQTIQVDITVVILKMGAKSALMAGTVNGVLRKENIVHREMMN